MQFLLKLLIAVVAEVTNCCRSCDSALLLPALCTSLALITILASITTENVSSRATITVIHITNITSETAENLASITTENVSSSIITTALHITNITSETAMSRSIPLFGVDAVFPYSCCFSVIATVTYMAIAAVTAISIAIAAVISRVVANVIIGILGFTFVNYAVTHCWWYKCSCYSRYDFFFCSYLAYFCHTFISFVL